MFDPAKLIIEYVEAKRESLDMTGELIHDGKLIDPIPAELPERYVAALRRAKNAEQALHDFAANKGTEAESDG